MFDNQNYMAYLDGFYTQLPNLSNKCLKNLNPERNLLWDEENRLLGVSDNGVGGSLEFAQCALQWSRERDVFLGLQVGVQTTLPAERKLDDDTDISFIFADDF